MGKWSDDILINASKESLIPLILELLKRTGFRESEKVSEEWGFDIVGIRDDPLSGTEKVLLKIHTSGMLSSKDVNVFADVLRTHKADKGIIVVPYGVTRDARILISRDYKGLIVTWDRKKLISLFERYGIEPPEELLQKREEEPKKEEPKLKPIKLDAPLLFDVSAEDLFRKLMGFLSSRYPIKREVVSIEELKVKLSVGYILSWSANERKGKGVVLSKEEIVLDATEDEKLKNNVSKALLNDYSVITATDKEIDVTMTLTEAVVLFKEFAAKNLGLLESDISIVDRKRVYLPVEAYFKLKIGDNEGKATIDLKSGEINVEITPLSQEYLVGKVKEIVVEKTGEEVKGVRTEERKGKIRVYGSTERFKFEFVVNVYTGEVLSEEIVLTDEAIVEIIKENYLGEIIGIERGKNTAIVDLLTQDGILIVEVDLGTGKIKEAKKLPTPEKGAEIARNVVIENFPIKNIEFKSYRILNHQYLEITLEGEDGKAIVKLEGERGEVLDYSVEISEKVASELVRNKYAGKIEVEKVEKDESSYIITGSLENHKVKIKVSKDGKILEEIDRVLKEEVAKEKAIEAVKKVESEGVLESLELNDNWIVKFSGPNKVGTLILHRATGEVINRDVRFTELWIEKTFYEHLKRKYGESNLKTEWLIHHKDKGQVTIKVTGDNGIYYGKIDVKTGEIIEEDKAPKKGVLAKIKQLQLDAKYK
ncbi:restriction endonuclease [Pyrococcus furiosus DSM 3638]|uniref:Restriction endonuclease type IV Mrr domain-containing protein n=3 Tax=Pyrococcus furiosus TaxID=2261 RepID=Q8U1R9_PYRFU|nr:restriction endonuclease [Pyrococcus furiosus]AAL81260.1 hypothetical protein PF1136 [Pyrococcus furiosus DSM 3638]AFN03927.1 hypothetical protein PFC_04900 [Pyrococcus furiosus COM1]QEK78791.1 restriction endonuclease [Pyrococcus furiosus DSM 3638]